MAGVRVFFTRDNAGTATEALRTTGLSYDGNVVGFSFDSVEYTSDHRLARLERGTKVVHVPTRNILMIVGDADPESE